MSGILVPVFAQMTWTLATGSAAWSQRELHSAIVFEDAMWVIYGRGDSAKNVWRSTDGANWTLQSTGSGYRNDHASVVFDGKMWVLGGYDTGSYKNDVWYSPDGVTWTKLTTGSPMWEPRIGHEAVVFDNKMWVMGGYAYPNSLNDVWYSPGLSCIGESPGPVPADPDIVLSIAPNPVAGGFAVLRLGLSTHHSPLTDHLRVHVFDAAGRCVLHRSLVIGDWSLGIPLDCRGLSNGVYLVRLDAGGRTAAQQLVVQR